MKKEPMPVYEEPHRSSIVPTPELGHFDLLLLLAVLSEVPVEMLPVLLRVSGHEAHTTR